jgi:hypothetical protein
MSWRDERINHPASQSYAGTRKVSGKVVAPDKISAR